MYTGYSRVLLQGSCTCVFAKCTRTHVTIPHDNTDIASNILLTLDCSDNICGCHLLHALTRTMAWMIGKRDSFDWYHRVKTRCYREGTLAPKASHCSECGGTQSPTSTHKHTSSHSGDLFFHFDNLLSRFGDLFPHFGDLFPHFGGLLLNSAIYSLHSKAVSLNFSAVSLNFCDLSLYFDGVLMCSEGVSLHSNG